MLETAAQMFCVVLRISPKAIVYFLNMFELLGRVKLSFYLALSDKWGFIKLEDNSFRFVYKDIMQ